MMRNLIRVCVILAVSLIGTGCAGKYVGKTGDGTAASGSAVSDHAVSGSAVSGAAVSGAAVSGDAVNAGEEVQKCHRFTTDTNFYLPYGYDEWEGKADGVTMYGREDVSKKEDVKIGQFASLIYVTGEGLYYFRTDHTLWRMPIVKNEEGTDRVRQGGEEKILEEKDGIIADSGCYVNDSYIVYITYKGNAVKYDRKTGKKSIHPLEGNIASLSYMNERSLIIFNTYSLRGEHIHWDLVEDTWTPFFEDRSTAGCNPIAVNGDFYFYARDVDSNGGEEVRLYDAKKKKDDVFVSRNQLDSACEAYVKDLGGKYQFSAIGEIFSCEDKFYVEMQVDWHKNNTYWMRYVTLCMDLKGKQKLYVAQDWMDFKKKNSQDETIYENVDGCEKVMYNASSGINIVDGKVIMLLGNADDIACYDPVKNTGKIITEKNKEYYFPYYDTSYEEAYPEWQMEGGMNFVPEELEGVWGC